MNETKLKFLREKANNLPKSPGVYIMKNDKGKVIYVGKAKVLKNRVSSYFHSIERHTPKVAAMVDKVNDFEVMLTDTEFEALLLECGLIKTHMPRYNILLKDDKGYCFIRLTVNEDYPRLMLANKRAKDKALYFGPYMSRTTAKNIISVITKTFKLPTCNFNTTKAKRSCLYKHINMCVGLCEGKITKEEYKEIINSVIGFLEGNTANVQKDLKEKMLAASESMDFERAAYYRDCLKSVEALEEKQRIVFKQTKNVDAFVYKVLSGNMALSVLPVRKGLVLAAVNYREKADENENPGEILYEYILRYYEASEDIPPQIYLQAEIEDKKLLSEYLTHLSGKNVKISVPKSGDGVKLIEMATANANEFLIHSEKKWDKISRAAVEFTKLIGAEKEPEIIEMFDISQTAGADTVCGMVVFKDFVPEKSLYKRFSIKEETFGDDLKAMSEAVRRRIKRYKEGSEGFDYLPDLIIVDGGLNQVNTVNKVLSEEEINVAVIGFKKDTHHKTRAIVLDTGREIILKRHPEVFYIATKMQDEVHRFALSYHKTKRSNSQKGLSLTKIEGVGEKKAKILLAEFKTITAIKKASVDELANVKGIDKKTAKAIYDYYSAIS